MRSEYFREAIALLERAQQTEILVKPLSCSKQADDILVLVAELKALDNLDFG